MVTSTETSTASPPSDPLPPPSNGHDLLSFPILKPRSKRRPAAKFPPPLPSPDKGLTVSDEVEALEERPWNLRSCRGGSIGRLASWRQNKDSHRPRFSVPLSTDEIEEDIYAVTGSRPRRRPRKRPRVVQKQVDVLGVSGIVVDGGDAGAVSSAGVAVTLPYHTRRRRLD